MWALRRSSNLKGQVFNIRTCRACVVKSEVARYYLDGKTGGGNFCLLRSDGCTFLKRFYSITHGSPKVFMGSCSFSSQVDTKSSAQDEDDLEDGFSELENPASAESIEDNNTDEESGEGSISQHDLPEEDDVDDVEDPQNDLEIFDAEGGASEKKSSKRKGFSALFKFILTSPGLSLRSAVEKWVEEGNDLTGSEIYLAMLNFRKRKMYGRALQLSEWMESNKELEFVERDYASRLDLIAKLHGIARAEKYIENIPKSFRGEVVYRTLLANCVAATYAKKAEEVFNKMKDLEFPITTFACNQLLLLYKKTDKKKIADILLLMEKENVKPSLFTYKILIDTKGRSNDITAMDQIVETMKAEGIEPDLSTQALLAKHYVSSGLKEKAEAILKELEGGNLEQNRGAACVLLPLYAGLGRAKEVGRVWKVCEPNPKLHECLAAIEAWGKLKKIEEAEAIFEKMAQTWEKLSAKHFSVLLKVYETHKMLAKGKDLVKRMSESGCRIGPFTWDSLVKLYVHAGEVEKADSILQKATLQNKMRAMFSSYMTIMDQYSQRGDIHNTEKMFCRIREAGYPARLRMFQSLIQAYINAKSPAYGIKERMKAENLFPSRAVAAQLAQVDAFKKSPVSDLLD